MQDSVVSTDPGILGGTPVFSGTRVPVRILQEHLVDEDGFEEFLDQFPSVSRAQALRYLEEVATLPGPAHLRR